MTFSKRIALAFGVLATLAAAQGATGWWIADVAEHRVVRGRVAGDLHSGFLQLSAEKQRLRAWVLQSLIGADPDPELGQRLGGRMLDRISALRILSAEAERMDRAQGKQLDEHAQRKASLDLLEASVEALVEELPELSGRVPLSDALASWMALERVFDRYGERDLREVLATTIAAEEEALARERLAADASLERAQLLSLSAGAVLISLSLLLAAYFMLAFRRPLRALSRGAEAYGRGDLAYRVGPAGGGEFTLLAARMNQMAHQLSVARDQETDLRESLEQRVHDRTAELKAALADLERSEARRRQLLADIGHELRTPTTAIRGEAEIALRARHGRADDYREALERIASASSQLGDLIGDLLTLALEDSQGLAFSDELTDPDACLAEAVRQAEALARARGVLLQRELAGEDVSVIGDTARLRQLFGTLLDNAVRYSASGGMVRIRSVLTDEGWAAVISDEGIGLDDAATDRLFERGYRTAAARAHRADGSGLGLAIARMIAERHGGQVSLSPGPHGVGAVASVRLPLAGGAGR
jgi:two-component system, OmpR family, sensor kinase